MHVASLLDSPANKELVLRGDSTIPIVWRKNIPEFGVIDVFNVLVWNAVLFGVHLGGARMGSPAHHVAALLCKVEARELALFRRACSSHMFVHPFSKSHGGSFQIYLGPAISFSHSFSKLLAFPPTLLPVQLVDLLRLESIVSEEKITLHCMTYMTGIECLVDMYCIWNFQSPRMRFRLKTAA